MEDEKYIKFDIPEWVNWLARDSNGDLFGYLNRPKKGNVSWFIGDVDIDSTNTCVVSNDPDHYPQVKWSDEEPKAFKDGVTLTDVEVEDLTDEEVDLMNEDALRWGLKTVNKIREGEPDMIQNPPHYKQYSFEPIDIITEVVKEYPPEIGFHIGTTLKYLFRSPFKGKQQEDLAKSMYYLERAIKELTDE